MQQRRNISACEEIEHCKGCHTCWTRGPMQCVITDQMAEVLAQMGGADIIVFASPVYFGNISGMLKTFMDRMTMIGSPHSSNDAKKNDQQSGSMAVKVPKLMMISSCGFSDRTEFDVTSLWIKKVANKMNMELIAEIYATRGKDFNAPPESLSSEVLNYLQQVENAGKEIATDRKERSTYPSSLLILSSSC